MSREMSSDCPQTTGWLSMLDELRSKFRQLHLDLEEAGVYRDEPHRLSTNMHAIIDMLEQREIEEFVARVKAYQHPKRPVTVTDVPMHDPDSTHVPIPVGGILYFSSGEYTDYLVQGVFRALVEINADALWAEFSAECRAKPEQQFVTWLFMKGLLEPVESWELYIDYKDYKPVFDVIHSEAARP